jgi:hypothetical protein
MATRKLRWSVTDMLLLDQFMHQPKLTAGEFPTFVEIHGADRAAVDSIGINLIGERDCTIYVVDPLVSLGGVTIENRGAANEFLFGNPSRTSTLNIQIRVIGSACRIVMPELPSEILKISDIFLREDSQTVFWGKNTTAVDVSVELAGEGSTLLIGDDCMFSSGIWLRNYDMHSIFDLATDETLNKPEPLITIERHVWFGADACLIRANVGYGSIVGARAMVTSDVPPTTIVTGMPARILRTGVCWTRGIHDSHDEVRQLLRSLADIPRSEARQRHG